MESKDWSGFGYLSPDFSPGMPVSQRIWTPPGFASFFVDVRFNHNTTFLSHFVPILPHLL